MNILAGFRASAKLFIELDGIKDRRKVDVTRHRKTERMPLFVGDETVSGKVRVVVSGKKLEHKGLVVECIGAVETFDGSPPHQFVSRLGHLAEAGTFEAGEKEFSFEFPHVEKPHESYSGVNVRTRYYLRTRLSRDAPFSSITKEEDFWVMNLSQEPEINDEIKMEVGIEDALHIAFHFTKAKHHLRGVLIGKVSFFLVRIPIRNMDISIIRKESTGGGAQLHVESQTLSKVEVMDGAPVRGEQIPVRIFLGGLQVPPGPTIRGVGGKFSVKYFLHLVLYDESGRKYFKSHEIVLWRKKGQV